MLQQCGSPQHFMSHMPPFQKSPKRFKISLPGFSPHFSELECNFYSKKTGACCHAGNTTDTLGPWEHHLDHRVCPMYMYKENILEPLGRPWTLYAVKGFAFGEEKDNGWPHHDKGLLSAMGELHYGTKASLYLKRNKYSVYPCDVCFHTKGQMSTMNLPQNLCVTLKGGTD